MKPSEVAEVIRTSIKSRKMPAIHLWGPPGVGKSRLCSQVTEEERVDFIDMRLSMKDPSDIKGLPFPQEGKAKWLPPTELPSEGRGIILLDELNLAPPLVQASAYQLILDRKVGEYSLPEGWRIIAAGNKAEHGANVFKMPAPLRNRFIHIDFDYNLDDWRNWAIKNDIRTEVIEFISFRPDLLFDFKPDKQENAFPTPRSWEFVSDILQSENTDEELIHQIITGTVGAGAASEFKSYIKLRSSLPDIEEILAGKNHPLKDPDTMCSVVTALVIRAKPEQFERLLQYGALARIPEEAKVLMFRLMIKKNKKAVETSASWKEITQDLSKFIY